MQDSDSLNDVVFPETGSEFTTNPRFGDSFAQIRIPMDFLRERTNQEGTYVSMNTKVAISNIADINFQMCSELASALCFNLTI